MHLSDEAQFAVSDLGDGTHSNNNPQQRSKKFKVISDAYANNRSGPASLDDQQSDYAMIPTLDTGAQAQLNYVKAMIEASGLSTVDFSERCHSGDELLAQSLFDEVEISSSPQIDDPKLLFDCINEALEEIFNLQQTPVAQCLIRKVSRRIERQIPVHLPNSLDHMVTKDSGSGSKLVEPSVRN